MTAAMIAAPWMLEVGHSPTWSLLAQVCVGALTYAMAGVLLSWGQTRELWALLRHKKAHMT